MNGILRPPKTAERFLTFLLTQEDAEYILGDFAEMFNAHGHRGTVRKAQVWYWTQVIRSAPALLIFKLSNVLERRSEIMNSHKMPSIWISMIALIPGLILVIPGLMQSSLGYFGANNAIDTLFAKYPALGILQNPFLLLSGLLLVFVLNIIPAVKLHIERQPEGLTGVITFKPLILHWILVGTSLFLVGTILVYAFFENFKPAFH